MKIVRQSQARELAGEREAELEARRIERVEENVASGTAELISGEWYSGGVKFDNEEEAVKDSKVNNLAASVDNYAGRHRELVDTLVRNGWTIDDVVFEDRQTKSGKGVSWRYPLGRKSENNDYAILPDGTEIDISGPVQRGSGIDASTNQLKERIETNASGNVWVAPDTRSDADRGRDAFESYNNNAADRARETLTSGERAGGAELDRTYGISGLNKGGLVQYKQGGGMMMPQEESFFDKFMEARDAIKGRKKMELVVIDSQPMPPQMPPMAYDGQGDGPVGGSFTPSPVPVGPDLGPDTVDAKLTPGEYVMNQEATQMLSLIHI